MKITKKSPATLIRKNEDMRGYHLAEVSDGTPMFSKTSEYVTFGSVAAARKFANKLGYKLVWD